MIGLHYGRRVPRRRARPEDRAARQGRRPHLHRRQRRRRARLRLRRRNGLRVVSDHAVVVARRGVREVLRPLRVDKATGKNKFAIVQAEDELASIGIVIGAGWNGARAFTATSGPGRLADDRIHRPRLLRRDPGDDHRRAARRPVDRHADAHAAVRPARVRLRLARRHQARAAVPRGPERVLRVHGGRARPRRPAADAGVRDDRPRHRHEPPAVRAARLGRQPALRPRQGDERGGARGRQGLRPLPRRRRRRHPFRTYPARIRPGAPTSRAARRRTPTRATPRPGPTTSTTWSGC